MIIVRSGYTCLADGRDVKTSIIEHLDAMVVKIADIDVSGAIEGNTSRPIEVSIVRARIRGGPQLSLVNTVHVELNHTVRFTISYPDISEAVHRHI